MGLHKAFFVFVILNFPITSSFLNCGNCIRGDSLICPDFDNTQFEVKLHESIDGSIRYLQLTCFDVPTIDFNHMRGCSFPFINYLKIKLCPLPNDSLSTMIEMMGLTPESIEHLIIYHPLRSRSVISANFLDRFSNLKYLDLEATNLTELPENIFSPSPDLEKIYIRGNSFKEFKAFLFQSLSKLEILNLNHNSLEILPENTFKGLLNLEGLYLWSNNLTQFPPNIFNDLVNLRNLSLNSNKISSLNPDIFTFNTHLEHVNLNRNDLSSVPEHIFLNNTLLKTLRMNNNNLDDLPVELFRNCVNVTLIDIKNNQLGNLSKSVFSYLEQLEDLNLSRNNLRGLPEDLFSANKKLTSLDISHNFIHNISSNTFRPMRQLKRLFLNHNTISQLPTDLFKENGALEYLKLNNNNLTHLFYRTFAQRQRSSLKIIDLSHNKLNEESVTVHFIFALNAQVKLQEIDLSFNNFTVFPDDALFFNFLHLKTLNFEGNAISHIHLGSLLDLVSGISINLRYNNIETIQNFARNENKRIFVQFAGNNLTCDCHLYDFTSIMQSDTSDLDRLSYSTINKRDLKVYREIENRQPLIHVTDKEKLVCARPGAFLNHRVVDIPRSSLSCNMREQDCSGVCPCSYWPFGKKIIVDCYNLDLKKVPSVVFNPNFNYHLNLEGNQISTINFSTFDPVMHLSLANNNLGFENLNNETVLPAKLQFLNLTNNNLTLLNEVFLDQLHSIDIETDFSDNPWRCDCSVRPLHNFIQANFLKVSNIRNVLCDDIDNTPIIDLTEEHICPVLQKPEILASIAAITGFLVLIAILGTVVYYRYRTSIKIWLYSHKLCLWFVTEAEIDCDKKYDAFISYSHKDEEFVNNVLVAGLENGDPCYRVCLHYRDWVAGEFIQNQIMTSVQDSRRTLVVLSKNFIDSVWGQMEFRAAHQQALKDKTNRVIVIVYGEMPPANSLDEELRHYVSLHTYLKWGDPRFWPRLRYAMPHSKPPTNGARSPQNCDKLELVKSRSVSQCEIPV